VSNLETKLKAEKEKILVAPMEIIDNKK